MRSFLVRRGPALATLCLLAAPLRADLVVDDDGGPGVDFLEIAHAVAAAAPGETIRVRAGTYLPFDIAAKGLLVLADAGADVRVVGTSLVRDVGAGSQVRLAGLRLEGPPAGAALRVEDCVGPVWIERCAATGGGGSSPDHGGPGVQVLGCERVVLARGSSRGGPGVGTRHGGPGLVVSASEVTLLDALLRGGDGADEFFLSGSSGGGDGAVLSGTSTHAFFASCTVRGGDAGDTMGSFDGCDPPPPAGAGLRLTGGPSASTYAASFAGGVAGVDVVVGCTGSPGNALEPPWAVLPEEAWRPLCIGSPVTCPCANGPFDAAGCDGSAGLGGGVLDAVGEAVLAADTLSLVHTGAAEGASVLFLQGDARTPPAAFGDGLRCVGGAVVALGSKPTVSGLARYGPLSGDPPLSVTGGLPPGGGVRFHQALYRDAQPFCTPASFNLSSALEVRWSP